MKSLLILIFVTIFAFANEDDAYEKIDCNFIEPEVQYIIDSMTLLVDNTDRYKYEILKLYDDLNYYAVESIKCEESERIEILSAHQIVTEMLLQIGYIQ